MAEKPVLTAVQGSGSTIDRTNALREALIEAIEAKGMGMTVASVVGTLETLKHEIITEWQVSDD